MELDSIRVGTWGVRARSLGAPAVDNCEGPVLERPIGDSGHKVDVANGAGPAAVEVQDVGEGRVFVEVELRLFPEAADVRRRVFRVHDLKLFPHGMENMRFNAVLSGVVGNFVPDVVIVVLARSLRRCLARSPADVWLSRVVEKRHTEK